MEGNDKELITRADLAELLGVCSRTLRRWEQRGWLPSLRVRRMVRYRYSDVKKLIQDLTIKENK